MPAPFGDTCYLGDSQANTCGGIEFTISASYHTELLPFDHFHRWLKRLRNSFSNHITQSNHSMRIGIFADAHDHVDNVRRTVNFFNQQGCKLVLFAGDFVSPLVVPPMRKLTSKLVACFGDNDGNQRGIIGGMRVIGPIANGPVCVQATDGTKILMTHILNDVRDSLGEAQIIVFAHTHRPSVVKDANGRLFINPGETGGWSFRKPTIALVDTDEMEGQIVTLPELPAFEG